MEKLDKEKFEYWGRWVAPTLAWELGYRWSQGRVIAGLAPDMPTQILALDGRAFYLKASREHFNRKLEEHIDPIDTKYFEKYQLLSETTIDDFLSLIDEIPTRQGNWQELLRSFFEKYEELWSPWMAAFFVGDFIELQIQKLIAQYSLPEEEVLASIFTSQNNFSQDAKRELLSIQAFAKQNNLSIFLESADIEKVRAGNAPLAEKIEAYIKKYAWLGTHHFWGTPYTSERFFEEILTITPKNPGGKKNQYPANLTYLLELAGYSSWLRQQCAEASDMVAYAFRPILNKAADTMNISYDDLIWLTHEEILRGIDGQGVVLLEVIHERKKGWGAVLMPEKVEVFEGQKLKDLLDVFVEKRKDANITEFKGASASRGYAQGKVKVILVPHIVTDFEKGDILVAPETTPDFVPHMKNAAGIITDQGGITSHAAIISREFGIPCIVGTKIATQALKDGDVVEVDAERGIVKILKRGSGRS